MSLHLRGDGRPFQFQHGLLGDHRQTFEAAPDLPDWQLRTLDCPGHGGEPLDGPPTLAGFAEAVAAVTPAGAVLGGISMGAAIALRIAAMQPALAAGLVLVRPAWGTSDAPPNMAPNALAGRMIAEGATAADFRATPEAETLARAAPDNLASLLSFFDRPDRATAARLLTAISADGPGLAPATLSTLDLPALVCGTAEDLVHPLALARDIAAALPRARFVELPPKGRDKAAHLAALHAAIATFLQEL